MSTPEDADELWRKVKAVEEAARLARVADATVAAMARVRVRAKTRWGELLPEPEQGKRTDLQPFSNGKKSVDPVAESRARKLAAFKEKDPTGYESAVQGDDPERAPSEASVLRLAAGAIHRSSARDEWETPQDLFDELNSEFRQRLSRQVPLRFRDPKRNRTVVSHRHGPLVVFRDGDHRLFPRPLEDVEDWGELGETLSLSLLGQGLGRRGLPSEEF